MPPPVTRPLSLASFAVRGEVLVAVDDSIPVVVEVDIKSGRTTRVYEWPLSDAHRGRSVALEVSLEPRSILVASPAAGGLVRIDRTTGEAAVIALAEEVGSIVTSEGHVWAIAAPDWEENVTSPLVGAEAGQRTVIWEEAPEQTLEPRSGWVAYAPLDDDGHGEPPWSLDDWREMEGDTEPLRPPTPIWKVDGISADRLPFEGEAPTLTAIGDRLVGVCQLPADPIVKTVEDSSVSWGYPGSAFVIEKDGSLRVAGAIGFTAGSAWTDSERVWLVGFGSSLDGEDPEVREVLPDAAVLSQPLEIGVQDPLAVCNGYVVDISWRRPPVVRLIQIDGDGDPVELIIPELERWQVVKTDGDSVFVSNRDEGCFIQISTRQRSARVIRPEIDLADHLPHPEPPEGVDLRAHEEAELVKMKASLLDSRTDDKGHRDPLIQGVTFESVEREGLFPKAAVVGIFRSEDRPGVLFARRWPLYDELGNPYDLDYQDIHLVEDIESGAGGLPLVDDCVPDDAGVVWF